MKQCQSSAGNESLTAEGIHEGSVTEAAVQWGLKSLTGVRKGSMKCRAEQVRRSTVVKYGV